MILYLTKKADRAGQFCNFEVDDDEFRDFEDIANLVEDGGHLRGHRLYVNKTETGEFHIVRKVPEIIACSEIASVSPALSPKRFIDKTAA